MTTEKFGGSAAGSEALCLLAAAFAAPAGAQDQPARGSPGQQALAAAAGRGDDGLMEGSQDRRSPGGSSSKGEFRPTGLVDFRTR